MPTAVAAASIRCSPQLLAHHLDEVIGCVFGEMSKFVPQDRNAIHLERAHELTAEHVQIEKDTAEFVAPICADKM